MAGYYKKIKKDLRDIYEFYVDDKTRGDVDSKGWASRLVMRVFYVFKAVLTKFNPLRKFIFIIALILLVSGNDNGDSTKDVIAAYMLLFLLLLELKDKLLVRRELEAGRAVQEALIPKDIPEIEGWDIWLFTRPANDVGGDLVDYLQIDKHRHFFVLADLAGKGLGAALLMSKLQATLRAIVLPDLSLDAIAEKLNQIFTRDVIKTNFATLIGVILDSKTDQIVYVNAGHLPPLKLTSSGIHEEKKGQPAIGLSEKTKYKITNMDLRFDETFLIYSDGITEARRQDGVFYGDESFHTILRQNYNLPSVQLGQKILMSVESFLSESSQSDDISMLIFKRK